MQFGAAKVDNGVKADRDKEGGIVHPALAVEIIRRWGRHIIFNGPTCFFTLVFPAGFGGGHLITSSCLQRTNDVRSI
jgi:hypothetical protein